MPESPHVVSAWRWEFKVSTRLILWSSILALGLADCRYRMPGLNVKPYMKRGDINIGAVMALTSPSKTSDACSTIASESSFTLQMSEAVAYAVKMVNNDPRLLPNVTMGFVILDGCSKESVTLASFLSYLPLISQSCGTNVLTCKGNTNLSTHYDVIGAVGPFSSVSTIPVSSLFSVAHMSLIGYTATSDTLSDKSQHPFYFRVVPPDKHQVEAMLKFISGNDWSYISAVYMQGAYGEKAFDNIKELSPNYGICIATHHRLISNVDYDNIASELVDNLRARVVVLFMEVSQVRQLFHAIKKLNHTHHFIWIGSDAWAYGFETTLAGYEDITLGAFSFTFYNVNLPDFYKYVRNLSVATSTSPVLKSTWEYLTDCSFKKGTCDPNENILLSIRNSFYSYTSLVIDSVLTFAHAAHRLLRNRCPNALGQNARNCIIGEVLKKYLKNTSFEGTTGQIKFNEHNDVEGRYLIRQIVHGINDNPYLKAIGHPIVKGMVAKNIGVYYTDSKTIEYSGRDILWSHLDRLDRIVPLRAGAVDDGRPESVCSRPCVNGEYKIGKKFSCCWQCRRCQDYEKIVNFTSCERCPTLYWPDSFQNYTKCTAIIVTYTSLNDTLQIILFCMALIESLFTIVVVLAYIKYRNERIMKAASRELSFMQLSAIFLGYVTVILLQVKPSKATCKLTYLLFCLSFALLYCPLLVKTVRIFRIFTISRKTNLRPRYISPHSQIVMSTALLGVQIIFCIVTFVKYDPTSRSEQMDKSKKLVELTCDLTVPGLASFLVYNLILVTVCSIFAFKTRKLPDNFNEALFISMCVFTTLVIWLAFIPAYFTAGKELVRELLLSVALLLNHSVALLFLFVPKIYVVIWRPPEQGNTMTTRFQTQAPTQRTDAIAPREWPPGSNQVSPLQSVTPQGSFDRGSLA